MVMRRELPQQILTAYKNPAKKLNTSSLAHTFYKVYIRKGFLASSFKLVLKTGLPNSNYLVVRIESNYNTSSFGLIKMSMKYSVKLSSIQIEVSSLNK